MLTVQILLLIVALLFTGSAPAHSQEPPPTAPKGTHNPGARTKQHNERAEAVQRGTETSPVFIKMIPPLPVESKTTKEAADRTNYMSSEWWLVYITGLLVIFTSGLMIYTAKLWGATKALAEDAKRTADRQAREMQESLRIAGIGANAMEKVAQNISVTASQQMRAYCMVIVSNAIYQERSKGFKFQALPRIINTGQTPARKVGYRASAAILPAQLPDDFAFPLPDAIIGAGVLGQQHHFEIGVLVDEPFVLDEEVEDIKRGRGRVMHVWGVVNYIDIFDMPRETRFCHSLTWRGEGKEEHVFGYYNPRHNEAT